jgi:hypothetical protein
MKLVLCTDCQDIIRLVKETRTCMCGRVSGYYVDDLHAEYTGDSAIPLGFNNRSLVRAVVERPKTGMGRDFIAFVIAEECETFKKLG